MVNLRLMIELLPEESNTTDAAVIPLDVNCGKPQGTLVSDLTGEVICKTIYPLKGRKLLPGHSLATDAAKESRKKETESIQQGCSKIHAAKQSGEVSKHGTFEQLLMMLYKV
jgi:hypothetical protein